jgi:hypothetical protein
MDILPPNSNESPTPQSEQAETKAMVMKPIHYGLIAIIVVLVGGIGVYAAYTASKGANSDAVAVTATSTPVAVITPASTPYPTPVATPVATAVPVTADIQADLALPTANPSVVVASDNIDDASAAFISEGRDSGTNSDSAFTADTAESSATTATDDSLAIQE